MKLTKEQAIAEHRKMWRWIAVETLKRERLVFKGEYMAEFFPKESIVANCFCCEYNSQMRRKNGCNSNCQYCPIDWGSRCKKSMCCNKDCDGDERGLYELWDNLDCTQYKLAAEYARQIAELPERKMEE